MTTYLITELAETIQRENTQFRSDYQVIGNSRDVRVVQVAYCASFRAPNTLKISVNIHPVCFFLTDKLMRNFRIFYHAIRKILISFRKVLFRA
jgi:hypothetical protein